jgi:hypothetical protein
MSFFIRFARKVCLAAWKDFLLEKAMLAFFICVDSFGPRYNLCISRAYIEKSYKSVFRDAFDCSIDDLDTFSGPKFGG